MKISVEDVKGQLNQENAEITSAMENVDLIYPCIDEFVGAAGLKAQAYDKFDQYLNSISKPLVKAVLCMMEAKLTGNRLYYSAIERNLAGMGEVDYNKLCESVRDLEGQIKSLESNAIVDFLSEPYTLVLENIIRMTKEKIHKVETFLTETNGYYNEFITTYGLVMQGISCAQSVGYNRAIGAMSSLPYDKMDWASTVRRYYDEKTMDIINEKYGDYYSKNPSELNKLKQVVEYERFHTKYIEATDKFLEVVDMKDRIGIKSVVYAAEEPYRTLLLDHFDDFEMKTHNTESTAYYSSADKAIVLNIDNCRSNNYHVFFHECGHAIDSIEGFEAKTKVYFSENFVGEEGKSLDQLIRIDVEDKVGGYVDNIIQQGGTQYKNSDVNTIKENVVEYIMSGGYIDITNEESKIADKISQQFAMEAIGRENALVSDVYSGATNFELVGSYSHMNSVDSKGNYWYFNNGDVRRLPSVEYVAEYYAYAITKNDKGLASVSNYLGKSVDVMEEMLEKMASN